MDYWSVRNSLKENIQSLANNKLYWYHWQQYDNFIDYQVFVNTFIIKFKQNKNTNAVPIDTLMVMNPACQTEYNPCFVKESV